MQLSRTSRQNLHGCHPDGIILCATAIQLTAVDFGVSESLRSDEQQRKNIALGVSWTMDSHHLKQPDGYAHAWDVYAAVDGKALYAWPLLHKVHEAFLEASDITGIPFEWGGLWEGKKADGPHFQLPRSVYRK